MNFSKTARKGRGIAAGQPFAYVRGHARRIKLSESEQFAKDVFPDPNTGCHLWAGGVAHFGYGSFYYGGKTRLAHRAAWELANGPIPAGSFVLHSCDTPCCVNLDHLRLGTQADNMADMAKRKRGRRGMYPRGVKPSGPKWSARVCLPGQKKGKHIGSFSTMEEAAMAVERATKELQSEVAQ